ACLDQRVSEAGERGSLDHRRVSVTELLVVTELPAKILDLARQAGGLDITETLVASLAGLRTGQQRLEPLELLASLLVLTLVGDHLHDSFVGSITTIPFGVPSRSD